MTKDCNCRRNTTKRTAVGRGTATSVSAGDIDCANAALLCRHRTERRLKRATTYSSRKSNPQSETPAVPTTNPVRIVGKRIGFAETSLSPAYSCLDKVSQQTVQPTATAQQTGCGKLELPPGPYRGNSSGGVLSGATPTVSA